MLRVRSFCVAVVTAVWMACAPGDAIADPPLANNRDECFNNAALRGFESVSGPRDPIDFLGEPGARGTLDLARRASRLARRDQLFQRFREILGARPLVSLTERGRPDDRLRAYVPSKRFRVEVGAPGVFGSYCRADGADPNHGVLLIRDNVETSPYGDRLPETLAHELFHAFQAGAHGRVPPQQADGGSQWWLEGTAEWAALSVYPDHPPIVSALDSAGILRPDLALDAAGREGVPRHPYGMWRFVQFLQSLYEFERETFLRGLRASFSDAPRTGISFESVGTAFNPADPAGMLRSALAAFWLNNLFPLTYKGGVVSGPIPTPGTTMQMTSSPLQPNAGDPYDTGPPVVVPLTAGRRAVATARVPLEPGVGTVRWRVDSLQPGAIIGLATGPVDQNLPNQQSFSYYHGEGIAGYGPTGATGCLPAAELRIFVLNPTDEVELKGEITLEAAGVSTGCSP